MSEFYDNLETRDPTEREQALILAVGEQVAHAKKKAPIYQSLLADFDPDEIIDNEAITKLPITRKSELIEQQQNNRPFGGYAAIAAPELAHVFASPGPIYEPGNNRHDYWRFARTLFAAGIRPGELIQNCFSYHFTPAGSMLDSGAHALGCSVIPAGVGQTELQVQTIVDLSPQAYVGTPSFLKIILDKADELGSDVGSINKAMVTGEALPPSLRAGFVDRGIRVQQCYATADLGSIAYESSAQQGLIIDEGVYLEIVRPGSGDPVDEGEVGEVIVTSLNPEYPLIRFATGDLSAIMPGISPCGRTNKRIQGWMGRADQTAKVRGMFIHPEQIDRLVKRHPEIVRARLIIDWIDETDQIKLQCESASADESLKTALIDSIRQICKLRGEVELVEPGNLPNDGKIIDDIRQYD